ncbi:ABC transporter ATP-binding protein [Dictyobacter kobayashii]|uniref:ABC transporter ATP-binding protein n=1 Tax=Dictyobacter kobayashii TaxID=2014872 RepID=A0A402AX80_9CHLR|nr:ABC transporter ATP-binding protein [Dictyobacter kobayashii]GCE23706.1 ABC transporter ATP-binding protein [Dictyobacter kobayashii]
MQVTQANQQSSSSSSKTQLKENWRIYMRIIKLLRPHWGQAIATVICIALATGFSLMVPWLLEWVVDVGIRSGRFQDLLWIALAILVTSGLRGLFSYGQGYFSQAISSLVAYDLRNMLYDHLQHLSFSFHDDSETGQLMSRMTADIEAVRNFFPMGLMRALVAVVTFVSVTVLLLRLDVYLALITLISVPIMLVLSAQVVKRLRPLWLSVQNGVGDLSTIMQESLSGVRVVKSFAREEYEIEKYGTKNLELRELNMSAMRLSAWNQPLLVLSLNVVTVLVLWVGGIAVINRTLSLGTLVAVTNYILLLGAPVRTFGFMINWWVRGLSGGTRIFSVLDTPSDITDAPNAKILQKVAGHVRYENVSFAYSNGVEVLHDLTIDAEPGQTIAILGPTGSGKSSMLHLLPRFYDTKDGRVLVDGSDVRDVTLASLRRNIGLVLQDVFLFNATIRENIAYGVSAATDEQIIEAAKAARIHDFILALPDGYDTWVGERGVTLSGGQKQRVAIARTLLLDPSILVLDDSTSSVDMETEYLIQQALEEVMRGRTTFVVASRLRTIKNADQILVLDRGSIVERGTHDTLLKRNGPYARLYDLQLREQEEFEAQMLEAAPPDLDLQTEVLQ